MGKTKKHKKFFEQDTPHGIVKRVMYKKYLQAYIAKTQNEKFNLKTIIIDGFAGAGRYSEDWPEEIEKYGSPLIALKVTFDFLLEKAKRLAKKTGSKMETNDEEIEEDTEESSISKAYVTKPTEESSISKASVTEPTEESSINIMSVTEPAEESSISRASVTEPRTDEQENKPQQENTQHCDVTSWISAVNLSDEELKEEAKFCRRNGFDNNTDITMIFIEADKTNYRNLVNNIELMLVKFVKFLRICSPTCHYKYSENSEEGIHSTTFSMNIPPYSFAIKVHNKKFGTFDPPTELEANCTRSLTFLDPFGFSQTPMAHVKKFAPGERNEIFINFMSQYVNRNIRNTPKYICDLYGIDVADETDLDTMIECIKNSLNSEMEGGPFKDKITRCTDMYTSYLKGQTMTSFSQAFEVKGQGNLIIYHLIHTTNHIRGIEAMKEAMNRCSQKPGEMAMSDYDIVRKGHILNFGNLDDPDVVADELFKKFKGKQHVLLEPNAKQSNAKLKLSRHVGRKVYNYIPTVKEFVLLDTKFLYRKNAIETLQRQGKITKVVDENNEAQKQKYRFPDKNGKTKMPKKWYVSFAHEAPVSDYSFKKRHEIKKKELEEIKKQKEVKRLQRDKEIMEKEKDRQQREEEKRFKRDKEETEKEKKRREKEEKRQQREKEKTEKEKKRQERKEKREKEKTEKEKKKNEMLEMKKQKEKKVREEEQKHQKREAERQKMSKQMKNYLMTTKIPGTKSIPETYTSVPIEAEMEPMITAETSASRVDEPEPMALVQTSACRVDEPEPMALIQTGASRVDEPEPMALVETSASRVDEPEPMALVETSPSRVDEPEPMALAQTSACRVDEPEPTALAQKSASRVDEDKPLNQKKIIDYFRPKDKGTVLTMYNNRDESSQELNKNKKKSNKRQKENKEERTRKKKRCEARRLSEVHDENEYVMTETERCTSGIGDNAPNDHGL